MRVQRMLSAVVLVLITVSATAAPRARMPKAWLGFGYNVHTFAPQSRIRQWLYVERLAEGGPAVEAGLRLQDAIVAIDGKPVNFANTAAALDYFASVTPGSVLRLDVIRAEKRMTVRLRARPLPPGYAEQWRRNQALAAEYDKAPAQPR